MNYQETEIKLPISDLASALKSLHSLGAKTFRPRHFEDNFIFDNETHFLRSKNMLLRLRIIGESRDQGILTFKGEPEISDGVKKREELECEIHGTENLIQTLSGIGFTVRFRYQKYRTILKVEEIPLDICIDETPIGNYFELEGEIGRIHEYAARLGFTRGQYITDSYVALYFHWCQERRRVPSHMTFEK